MQRRPASSAQKASASAVPVSYTHLDVYKRQLLILLVLFIVSLLVACRITPQALYDMVRPPEYEYEDEEERERYEAPLQLSLIHI